MKIVTLQKTTQIGRLGWLALAMLLAASTGYAGQISVSENGNSYPNKGVAAVPPAGPILINGVQENSHNFGAVGDNASVRAVPAANNYFFKWDGDIITDQNARNNPINIAVGMDAAITITYLISAESADSPGYGDLDGDKLVDDWEFEWGLDPEDFKGENGQNGNPDGDLIRGRSYIHPWTTGGDGYKGGNPFNNYLEEAGFDGVYGTADDPKTDPKAVDTDGDGLPDGWEYYFWQLRRVQAGLLWVEIHPLDPDNAYEDDDGDGLLNIDEYANGTDPTHCDTDADNMDDGWEVWNELNPLKPDDATQNPDGDKMAYDGTLYHDEVYRAGVLVIEPGATAFDPRTTWSDSAADHPNTWDYTSYDEYLGRDRIPRLIWDADGHRVASASGDATRPKDNTTGSLGWDTDGDNIPDGWECYVGLNPNNKDDAGLDGDGDGLNNATEWRNWRDSHGDSASLGSWSNKLWPTDPGVILAATNYGPQNIVFGWKNVWYNSVTLPRYNQGRDFRVFDGGTPDGWTVPDRGVGIQDDLYYHDVNASLTWDWGEDIWIAGTPGQYSVGDTQVYDGGTPWSTVVGDPGIQTGLYFYDSDGSGAWAAGKGIWRNDTELTDLYDATAAGSDIPIWAGGWMDPLGSGMWMTPDAMQGKAVMALMGMTWFDYQQNVYASIFWGTPGDPVAPAVPYDPDTHAVWVDFGLKGGDGIFNGETMISWHTNATFEFNGMTNWMWAENIHTQGILGEGLPYVQCNTNDLGAWVYFITNVMDGTYIVITENGPPPPGLMPAPGPVAGVCWVDMDTNGVYTPTNDPCWMDSIIMDRLYTHDIQVNPLNSDTNRLQRLGGGEAGSQEGLLYYHNDPHPIDTDFDGLEDGDGKGLYGTILYGERNVPSTFVTEQVSTATVTTSNGTSTVTATNIITTKLYGSNPTTVDSDTDALPDGWEVYAGTQVLRADASPGQVGNVELPEDPDPSEEEDFIELLANMAADIVSDPDQDGLVNNQEYFTGLVGEWMHFDKHRFPNVKFSSRLPMAWDMKSAGAKTAMRTDWLPLFIPADFMTCPSFNVVQGQTARMANPYVFYHTTKANKPDTDADGMDDYWEVYHGLNPLKGKADYLGKPKTDGSRTGGGAQVGEWTCTRTEGPYFDFGEGGIAWGTVGAVVAAVAGKTLAMHQGPFNFGLELMDPDGDGLPNLEEYSFDTGGRPFYHSDPTPYQRTDPVTLPDALLTTPLGKYSFTRENYVFDFVACPCKWKWTKESSVWPFPFEMVEGFDSDNDGFGDFAELNAAIPNTTGGSVPIESLDPIKNRALMLNLGSNTTDFLRTQDSYIVNEATHLVTFTLESWIMPMRDTAPTNQTIVERACQLPTPWGTLTRANFRLGLMPDNRPYVMYNGRGAFQTYYAVADPVNRISTNTWTHLSGVYDGQFLKLFINGRLIKQVYTREIPATGYNTALAMRHLATTIVGAREPDLVDTNGLPVILFNDEVTKQGEIRSTAGLSLKTLITEPAYPVPVYATEFFFGYLDEMRIWTGAKTQAQIQSEMRKKIARTATADTNAVLYSYYTFDECPDVEVNWAGGQSEARLPLNIEHLQGPTLPFQRELFWYNELPQKSTVYYGATNDPLTGLAWNYITFAEDVHKHYAQVPPTDDRLHPDRDTSGKYLGTMPAGYKNPMNLYEQKSGLTRWAWEKPTHDLLFLNGAQADGDVFVGTNKAWFTLWPLTEPDAQDSDGDGMPDNWETAHGIDPYSALGINGASGDPDGDGLNNMNEYLSGTDPQSVDTDGDGILDYYEDYDQEGLSNGEEQDIYNTAVNNPDTDDDGLNDKQEVDQAVNPRDSISPYVMRYILNPDGAGYISVPGVIGGKDPEGLRMSLTNWTIEAMVRLDKLPPMGTNAVVIRRVTEPAGYINYELGLTTRAAGNVTNAFPYVLFQTHLGSNYLVEGYAPVELGTWVQVGAKMGNDERDGHTQLALFYDNIRVVRDVTDIRPVTGAQRGDMQIAANLAGAIDELRIWNRNRTDAEIEALKNKTLLFGLDVARMGSLAVTNGTMRRDFNDDIRLTTNWTVEAWFKTTKSGVILQRNTGVIAKDSTPIYNYRMYVSPNGIVEAAYDFRNQYWGSDSGDWGYGRVIHTAASLLVNDGNWHHAAFVLNVSESQLYLDGALADSVPFPPAMGNVDEWHLDTSSNNVPSYFGFRGIISAAGPLTLGENFSGNIDEVHIMATPSTSGEIADRFTTKVSPTLPGMRCYFDFDDINLAETENKIPDKANAVAMGTMSGSVGLDVSASANAPIEVFPVDILAPKLAAYFPFDDGRRIYTGSQSVFNGRLSVEDFLHRLDMDYAGTLRPAVTNCDFYPSTNWFLGYEPPMMFPTPFPLPLDSPFRLDSDGDGMPDMFEQYYSLDANRAQSPDTPKLQADGDLDGDGLNNLYEYYCGSDPTFWDSNGNGVADPDEDPDGDGLPNRDEQALGSHPIRTDSDDDGFTDQDEAHLPLWSNPAFSEDPRDPVHPGTTNLPWRFKSLVLDGKAHQIPTPLSDRKRFNLPEWTLECWVYPWNNDASGALLSSRGQSYSNFTATPITFFELGLTNGTPYVAFQATHSFRAMDATQPAIPAGRWTHLAGVWDPENNALSLYRDGVKVAQREVFETAMSGSETANRFPGKTFVGSPSFRGNMDEIRIWSVPRNNAEIAAGLSSLIPMEASGLTCSFRFDDGRKLTNGLPWPSQEVNDGLLPADGQGAEDFAHPVKPDALETPWSYSLRSVQFDYSNAVVLTRFGYQDADHDTLPDWWESARFNKLFTYPKYIRGSMNPVAFVNERLRGDQDPAFCAAYLGWTIDYTPMTTIPLHRWHETPDAAWIFKDVYFDTLPTNVEIRMALANNPDSQVYINGQLLNLVAPGIQASPDTFVLQADVAPYNTYYVPSSIAAPMIKAGRNRITIQMSNQDGNGDENVKLYEYFNFQLLANGSQLAVAQGDRWWAYYHLGSMAPPPADGKGRAWTDADYSIDQDSDPDADGLLNWFEAMVRTNPKAVDTDNDGVPDHDADFDGDSLINIEEQRNGSDPRLPDTDDDGIDDGFELVKQTLATRALSPQVSRALVVNGSSTSYVQAALSPLFAMDNWTLSAWVNPSVISDGAQVVAGMSSSNTYSCFLGWISNYPCVKFTGTGGGTVQLWATNAIPLNAWTHLAGTFVKTSNNLLNLYINGALVRSQFVTNVPMKYTLSCNVGRNFNGKIDEAVIASSAFSHSEIQQIMQSGAHTSMVNLIAYYKFDDGTSAAGVSGSGWNEGQVQNFAANEGDWKYFWRNAGTLRGTAKITPSLMSPGVLYVTSPQADGVYYPGQAVTVSVYFSESVGYVFGSPRIRLALEGTNRWADYVGVYQPNSDRLDFRYIVQANDWSWDLDYVNALSLENPNGSLRDASLQLVATLLPAPGEYGSLGWNKNLLIDPPGLPEDFVSGMPTSWLLRYFGTTAVAAGDDLDRDGKSNIDEYRSGTNPNDPSSCFAFNNMVGGAHGVTVAWPAVEGHSYTVWYKTRVKDAVWLSPSAWQNMPYSGATMSVFDDGSLTGGTGSRFYKVTTTAVE